MNLNPLSETREYRMELFLRSLAPPGARATQESILDRLKQLDADDRIRAYDLTIWGERICLDVAPRTETERAIHEAVERIRRWERTHDVSLVPGFEEHAVDPLVGDGYTVLRPPVVALVVYEETDVWGVFPCRTDEHHVTVGACLDAFRGRTSLPASRPPD